MNFSMTLPNGVKFRTTSQRRYVLAYSFRGAVTILKRSDSLPTIQSHYAKSPDQVQSGDSTAKRRHFIVDTVAGDVIAHRAVDDFIWLD